MDNFCTWLKQVEDQATSICPIFNYKNIPFPWAKAYENKMETKKAAHALVQCAFLEANIRETDYLVNRKEEKRNDQCETTL